MDWLSGLFEVVGGGMASSQSTADQERADKYRPGKVQLNEGTRFELIIFFVLLLVIAILLILGPRK